MVEIVRVLVVAEQHGINGPIASILNAGPNVFLMRQVYSERISALAEAGHRRLDDVVQVVHATSGMRTVAWLNSNEKDAAVAEKACSRGLEVVALSQFTLRHSQPGALILGFAGFNPPELRRGVDVLANVLNDK